MSHQIKLNSRVKDGTEPGGTPASLPAAAPPQWTMVGLGCFFLPSLFWHLAGSELLLYISRAALPRVKLTCAGQKICCESLHITMSLRSQDMVRASELCRSSLTTSVLVHSLQFLQRPQAHHSDTVPATNWAWIIGHTDTCPFPSPSRL